MATNKQETLYNEIVEYYDFADKLLNLVEGNSDFYNKVNFLFIEKIIFSIEESADFLTDQFIYFVKNGSCDQVYNKVNEIFDMFLKKIKELVKKIDHMLSTIKTSVDSEVNDKT